MATAVFGIDYETAQRALQIATLACAVCAGSVVAAVVAYDLFGPLLRAFSRLWRRSRVECVAAAAVLGFVVAWGGSKGTISFPRTNADYELLKDAGSFILTAGETNDYYTTANDYDILQAFFTTHPLVPDTADVQMWRRPVASTNDADWALVVSNAVWDLRTFGTPAHYIIQEYPAYTATNWDWVVFTTWQPAPAVQTNGVLHVNWLLASTNETDGAATTADELAATPVKTQTAVARDAADVALAMTEAEAYAAFAPDTAFVIDLSLVGTNAFKASFGYLGPGIPRSFFPVDWGDGTTSNVEAWYWGSDAEHVYPAQGKYVIRIPDRVMQAISGVDGKSWPAVVRYLRFGDHHWLPGTHYVANPNMTAFPDGKLARWPAAATDIGGVYQRCSALAPSELPAWPSGVTSIKSTYYSCTSLAPSELPAWPESATTIQGVFCDCGKLNVATLPEWPKGATSVKSTYGDCASLAATNVPAWPAGLADVLDCYVRCPKLRNLNGPLPAWPTNLTNTVGTYSDCSSLTGEIPAWPTNAAFASAYHTYYGCSSLTGTIPAWPTNAAFASADGTYRDCSSLTGALPAWPTNAAFASANDTYRDCSSLTGALPAWPTNAAFASANYTYSGCSSLTGAWTDDPAELMPAHITSHSYTVGWSSAALQALFYPSWGGTRKEGE